MATLDQLSAALIKADAAGNADDAKVFADEIRKMRGATKAEPAKAEPSMLDSIKQGAGNLGAGLVRGAGSIGATLLYPIDKATDLIQGDRGPTVGGLISGKQPLSRNEERRQAMDDGLQQLGAQPDSLLYKGGKLVSEVAGTAGVGGTLAKGAAAVAPSATGFANALATGGFKAGATPGIANMLTRMAGGAVTGGASAALVDPESAGLGAVIGGAAPPVLGLAGKGANALGNLLRGPAVSQSVQDGVQAARGAGYVIPPSQAKPTLSNRLLEGMSGKITTAQNASARNQGVTNDLAAEALGLSKGTQLSPEILNNVRKQAGQAYQAVADTGMVTPGPAYEQALDGIMAQAKQAAAGFPNAKASPIISEIESLKSPQFDAGSALSKISQLRDQATAAYSSGDKGLGKALKSGADALEDAIDKHLQSINAPAEMLDGFRDARKLIAKTYTVEKALNATSGTVDAQKLASQLARGKPLSGELRTAAEFAQQFPKAAQPLEKMGSLPQLSPLDWAASGAASAATANPLMLASVLARPMARGLALSPMVQNRLASQGGTNSLAQLLANPDLAQLAYRAAPPLAASR